MPRPKRKIPSRMYEIPSPNSYWRKTKVFDSTPCPKCQGVQYYQCSSECVACTRERTRATRKAKP